MTRQEKAKKNSTRKTAFFSKNLGFQPPPRYWRKSPINCKMISRKPCGAKSNVSGCLPYTVIREKVAKNYFHQKRALFWELVLMDLASPEKWSYSLKNICQKTPCTLVKCSLKFFKLLKLRNVGRKKISLEKQPFFPWKLCFKQQLGPEKMIILLPKHLSVYLVNPQIFFSDVCHSQ